MPFFFAYCAVLRLATQQMWLCTRGDRGHTCSPGPWSRRSYTTWCIVSLSSSSKLCPDMNERQKVWHCGSFLLYWFTMWSSSLSGSHISWKQAQPQAGAVWAHVLTWFRRAIKPCFFRLMYQIPSFFSPRVFNAHSNVCTREHSFCIFYNPSERINCWCIHLVLSLF